MQSVVITGASTGIGWATAKLLLDRGLRVFGSVRKQADVDRLKVTFGANFTPLAAAREVRAALDGGTLAGLVNNAGIGITGPLLELSATEFRRQLEVNLIGPTMATQAFGPLLGSDQSLTGPKRRIVMVSSVSGKSGFPMLSAYTASKHAIEGLSESLRREMMLFGIDVIIVAPQYREDADLEQGRSCRHLRLQEFAAFPGTGKALQIHAESQRSRIATGADCRVRRRGLDVEEPKGALLDRAGSDAAAGDGSPAQAGGRLDLRQASRAVATDMLNSG
jgi:NAD(P)-dependent dehydrogenase (short-subunit alcohol dehydrogenase family)